MRANRQRAGAARGTGHVHRCAARPSCLRGIRQSPHLPAARSRTRSAARRWRRRQVENTTAPSPAQRDSCRRRAADARRAAAASRLLAVGLANVRPLNAKIERMERNLEALRAQARGAAGGAARSAIAPASSPALDANGCRDTEVAEREPPRRRRQRQPVRPAVRQRRARGPAHGRPERLPFERAADRAIGRQLVEGRRHPANVTRILNPNGEVSVLGPVGEFATMCVRTCDGYFFPMSPTSSSADFDRDQKNCEVDLPRHRDAALLSARGRRGIGDHDLGRQPASPIRRCRPPISTSDATMPRAAGCGCSAGGKNFSIIGGKPRSRQRRPSRSPRRRSRRPDPADDPETWPIARAGSTSTPSSAS